MIIWAKTLHSTAILPALPPIFTIASEVRMSYESYHFYGKTRKRPYGVMLFQYTLEGEGCFESKNGTHRVSKGKGFFCNVLDPEIAYYYPKDGDEPWRFVYIFCSGTTALSLVKDINKRYGHIFELPEDKGIIQKLIGFSSSKERQIMISPSESLTLLYELCNALLRSKEKEVNHAKENTLIRRFQQEIELNSNKNINVSQIAASIDVSREHLARVFRREMNTTPHKFLQNYKMQIACHVLKESSMSIKEISYKLGFDQPGHFTRTFKRFMGISPRDFRQSGDITAIIR